MNWTAWLIPLGGTFLASAGFTALMVRLARRWRACDHPDGFRKLQKRPVPLGGGVAVWLAICLGICLLEMTWSGPLAVHGFFQRFLVALALVCGLGWYDDLFHVRAGVKLAGQFLATLPLWWGLMVPETVELFGGHVPLGGTGAILAGLFLVGGMNAVNMLDGMDGLAASVAALGTIFAGCIAAWAGEVALSGIAFITAAAALGFLVHNRPPARIYLGDAGSLTLGLAMSYFAWQLAQGSDGVLHLPVLAGLFFLPSLDLVLAVIRRTLRGQLFWAPDREHLHHRLADRGHGVPTTLLICGTLTCGAGLLAYHSVKSELSPLATSTLLMASLPLLVWLKMFGALERRLLTVGLSKLARKSWRGNQAAYRVISRRLPTTPLRLVATEDTRDAPAIRRVPRSSDIPPVIGQENREIRAA